MPEPRRDAGPGRARASRVWLEPNDDPRRKLRLRLAAGRAAGRALGGHRHRGAEPRRGARRCGAGAIPALAGYGDGPARGDATAARSRVDFLLTGPGLPDALCRGEERPPAARTGDWAEFPDCVTARGARHLAELAAMVRAGHRAVMLYLVQRTDCARFALARDIDPAYAARLRRGAAAGVEALCHGTCHRPRRRGAGATHAHARERAFATRLAKFSARSTYLIGLTNARDDRMDDLHNGRLTKDGIRHPRTRGLRRHAPRRRTGRAHPRRHRAARRPRRRPPPSSTRFITEWVAAAGATSATIGYKGYQHASCICVNHVVCHGIPGPKIAQGRRHPEHRRHRDRRRLVRRHQPDVRGRQARAARPSG